MGRGTRQHSSAAAVLVAASADDGLRAALRGRAGAGRPAWVVLADLAGAADAVAAGEYVNLPEIARMVAANETPPAGTPDLYTAVAEQLLIRVETDPASRDAAMAYTGALIASTVPGSTICRDGLLRALSQTASADADQLQSGPRYVTRELLFRSGANTPPSVSKDADALVADVAASLPAQVHSLILTGESSYAAAVERARDQIARRSAAALLARLKRTPVMYGVWIRKTPKTKLPEVDHLYDALSAASGHARVQDATDVFRARLGELAA